MQSKIMGIINTTPDSFSDGGTNINIDLVLKKVELWQSLGVDIVDIGGESTRPGAEEISEELEMERTIPFIEAICSQFPNIFVSIDTMKYGVACEAIKAGAKMINDVSGLQNDPKIAELAARTNTELVIMHLPDKPRSMQNDPHYSNLIAEVYGFLAKQIAFAKKCGVEKIYSDVGIGFGKTFEHNLELLKNISEFESLGVPMLLGISRKRFIGELLGEADPQKRDFGTMMIHSLIMPKFIEIIRVHKVELACQMRKISKELSGDRA